MSATPTVLPQWGTTGLVVTPSSAKQQIGFVPGERPPAQYLNWVLVNTYLWLKWLSDGDCQFHNLSATGTLIATGLTSANGGVTVPTAQAVTLNGTSTLTVGTGAVSFGGTLAVTGLLSPNGGLTVPTAKAVTLSGTTTLTVGTGAVVFGGTLGVTGLITASGGVSANTINSYKFGGSSIAINPMVGDCLSASGSFSAAGSGVGIQLAASSQLFIRLPTFPANTTITGITLNLNVNVGTTNVLNVYYASITNGFAPTSGILNTITNAFTTGASNQISVIFTPQTLANGQQVWVFIQTSASGTAPIVNSIQITYQQN